LRITARVGSPESDDYVRLSLEGDAHPLHPVRKIELVRDTPPLFAPPVLFQQIWVLSLTDLAVAKLTALGRMEIRDFVDLYFIATVGGMALPDILPLAPQKDPGFTETQLAEDLKAVEALNPVARYIESYLLRPMEWQQVVAFCLGFAQELLTGHGLERG
jgi:hypothetical protein